MSSYAEGARATSRRLAVSTQGGAAMESSRLNFSPLHVPSSNVCTSVGVPRVGAMVMCECVLYRAVTVVKLIDMEWKGLETTLGANPTRKNISRGRSDFPTRDS